jgi:hypothetical protein
MLSAYYVKMSFSLYIGTIKGEEEKETACIVVIVVVVVVVLVNVSIITEQKSTWFSF